MEASRRVSETHARVGAMGSVRTSWVALLSRRAPAVARIVLAAAMTSIASAEDGAAGGIDGAPDFVRGDGNLDGRVTAADAIVLFEVLFRGRESPPCDDVLDFDDSGTVDLTDGTGLIAWTFFSAIGTPPPAPYPEAGADPTDDDLSCEAFEITPAEERENDAIRWDGPATGCAGDELEFFVRLTTSEPIECVQLAYLATRDRIRNISVDFEGTIVPAELQEQITEAGSLRWIYVPDHSPEFGLFRLVFLLKGPGFANLDFAATTRPLDDEPIVRVLVELGDEEGDGELLLPASEADLGDGAPQGLNELCTESGTVIPAEIASVFVSTEPPPEFIRGDANVSGQVTPPDALRILRKLFFDIGSLPCRDAADVNDDGLLDLSDPITILAFLFTGGLPPPPPFPFPGIDPTPATSLGCETPAVQPPRIDLSYVLAWDGEPEQLRGAKDVPVFLVATTSARTECFSIAYRVDKRIATNLRGDFAGTILPEDRQVEFLDSPFFEMIVAPIDERFDRLQVGALFTQDGTFDPIPFAATQGPIVAQRLFRVLIDIPEDAPLGDQLVFEPLPAANLPTGNAFPNEFCVSGPDGGAGGVPGAGGGSPGDGAEGVRPRADDLTLKIVGGEEFLRGDPNGDGSIDIADVVFTPNWLFGKSRKPLCMDAADVNADGEVNVSDAAYLANWLFSGTAEPPPPFNVEFVCEPFSVAISCEVSQCSE